MGKMSELDLTVKELRSAAESLKSVANSLVSLFIKTEPQASEVPDATEITKPKSITLEQVRAVLAEKSRNGHTADVRELLEKHGATKLSEIDPVNYPALLVDAEGIGNG